MESSELVNKAQKAYYDSLLTKVNCKECGGTGHIVEEATIFQTCDLFENPSFKLDFKMKHCEECHGNGYTYIETE